MSSFFGASLILPTSFNPEREKNKHYRSKSIESNSFASWAADHMYKSSYSHFHSKESTNPKSSAIPGYQGFIPQNRSESLHAKGFANMTKQVFGKSNYGKNTTGLNSNGFNLTKQALIDNSKSGSTSKYGQSSWLKAHPAWQSSEWKTTIQQSYINPKQQNNPLFRETNKKAEEYKKMSAISSGFSTNRAYLDGTGWNPEEILKAENISSQYRNIFNPQQQFHRDPNITKARRLKKIEPNYKFNF